MEDLLFDGTGQLTGVGASTRTHQQDLLLMHKGWNKFYPHVGVGIMDYLSDDGAAESLKSAITYEFERDGMEVGEMVLDRTGKVIVHANY